MSSQLVTVIIACYKSSPEYLRSALDSLVSQTWRNIEVLVCDDSPDDGLYEVVKAVQDSRVKYHLNNPRLGAAKNHWAAFGMARGEYIAILNHDDVYAPTFIQRLIEPLRSDSSLAIAFCDHWVIDAAGNRLLEATESVSRQWGRANLRKGLHRPFHKLLASKAIPMAIGAIFRRGLLPQEFPDNAGPAYDLWLIYLLCRGGHGAYYVPERLSNWRVHANSLTIQAGIEWRIGTARCWQQVSTDPQMKSIRHIARRKAAVGCLSCALYWLQRGERTKCLSEDLRSLRFFFTWKAIIVGCLALSPGILIRAALGLKK